VIEQIAEEREVRFLGLLRGPAPSEPGGELRPRGSLGARNLRGRRAQAVPLQLARDDREVDRDQRVAGVEEERLELGEREARGHVASATAAARR
jgi:hypothetical protein